MNKTPLVVLAPLCIAIVLTDRPIQAAPTPEQAKQLAEVQTTLVEAGQLYRKKKYKESLALVDEVDATLKRLGSGANKLAPRDLAPLLKYAKEARELISKKLPNSTPTPTPTNGVSFTKQVAPVLVAKCGNCHIRRMEGRFSMANFTALARGSAAGRVIFPKMGKTSPIIEVIESGDMPRGGRSRFG